MRIILVLALVLAACGSSTASSSTTTTDAPTTTSLASTSTSAPDGPSTTTTTEPRPLEPVLFDHPIIRLTLPDGVVPSWEYLAAVGEPGWVMVAGELTDRGVAESLGFWHTRDGIEWTVTGLGEILPVEFVEITDLVFFEGRFVASLMGDANTVDPTILVSQDGVDWRAESITVGSVASLPGVYATPESPPWPGASAITDLAIRGDELVAVGWVTVEDGSSPAVWRTTDVRTWSRALLPNQVSPNEWASRVAVGEAGYLVTGLGPFHQPDYLWSSADGQTWKPVQLTKEYFFGHGGIGVGDVFWTTLLFDDRPEELYRSDDGVVWEAVALPATAEVGGWGGRAMIGFGPDWLMLVTDPDASSWMLGSDGTRYTLPLTDTRHFGWILNREAVVAGTADGVEVMPVLSGLSTSVVDVASDDVLNVRAGPGVSHEIVATLPPDAAGILQFGVDVGGWYLIVGPTGQVGWVNGVFLSPEN